MTGSTRRFLFPAAAALVALLTVASAAVAASANNPKSDIQAGNGYCGADVPSLAVIGFVNYHRSGNDVTITYHLKGARPNEDYTVQLWGDACTYFGTVGTVTTNSNGVANLTGTITVPATTTRIFATAWNNNSYWNDTPAVTLAP